MASEGSPADPDAARRPARPAADADIEIPEGASAEEAAAIAAAVNAHLAAEAVETGTPTTWEGDRWRFRGRLAALREDPRIPNDAPTEPWRAAARTDRL